MVIYYERYVVIQAGNAVLDKRSNISQKRMQFLTEDEYLMHPGAFTFQGKTSTLEDSDPNKFIAKWVLKQFKCLGGA